MEDHKVLVTGPSVAGNPTVGQKTTVHIGEVSTLVKLDKQEYIGKTKRAGRKVSPVVECPQ